MHFGLAVLVRRAAGDGASFRAACKLPGFRASIPPGHDTIIRRRDHLFSIEHRSAGLFKACTKRHPQPLRITISSPLAKPFSPTSSICCSVTGFRLGSVMWFGSQLPCYCPFVITSAAS